MQHLPVLLAEVMAAVGPLGSDAHIVDATFGRGGHSRALLSMLGREGRVVGMDWDAEALHAGQLLARSDARFEFRHRAFADLSEVVGELGWGHADAVLMDLGVSSPMFDEPARGFSFQADGPLDMRMDQRRPRTAADLINTATERELADQFFALADERYSRRLAKAVIAARTEVPILRTSQLANIIAMAHPRWVKGQHPATKVFQALRIWVNGEFEQLDRVLQELTKVVRVGGRAMIISFHSGEDRRVKNFFRGQVELDPRLARLPQKRKVHPWRVVGKAVRASTEEVAVNSRARSAVLRVAERVDVERAA